MRIAYLMTIAVVAGSMLTGCAAMGIPKPKAEVKAEEERQHRAEMLEVFDKKRDAAQFQAALSRWQQGDGPGCRELIQQLLQRSPKHREARMLLAELRLVEETPQTALNDIQKLSSEYPDDAEIEHLLGLLFEASNRNDEALAHFRRAAEIDPANEVYAASYQTATQTELPTTPIITAQK
jgi:Flp pilus assembly protein TadD